MSSLKQGSEQSQSALLAKHAAELEAVKAAAEKRAAEMLHAHQQALMQASGSAAAQLQALERELKQVRCTTIQRLLCFWYGHYGSSGAAAGAAAGQRQRSSAAAGARARPAAGDLDMINTHCSGWSVMQTYSKKALPSPRCAPYSTLLCRR